MQIPHAISLRARAILSLCMLCLTLRHPLLIWRFVKRLGYFPNLALPRTYNEKMLWRKLFDRNPLFICLTDKIACKEWVKAKAPALALPITFWTGRDIRDAPATLLESQIVVKLNSGFNMNAFVSGGQPLRNEIHRLSQQWLSKRHGMRHGEWAYSCIAPQLIIEQRLVLGGNGLPTDIKVHVCGGSVCHVWAEDRIGERSLLLDEDGAALPGRDSDYPREDQSLRSSERLSELVREAVASAKLLASDMDYIRVDFLVGEDRLYVGELTVYSASGYGTWSNPAIAENAANMWDLRGSHFLRSRQTGLTALYAKALLAALESQSG